jgi:hypothetical protein
MMDIDLGQYGMLEDKGDHCLGTGLPTEIGPVDAQIDGTTLPASHVIAVLDRIKEIDAGARAYLDAHAPEDVQASGGLIEPSLLFRPENEAGSFTLFYSGSRKDDEMCYGVEFREFNPFDLTIGD